MTSRFLVLAICWCLVVPVAAADAPRDPTEYFFHETFGDFREELATVRAEGKQGVLLMFEMDECPFCHRMKTTVLNQPDVQAFYREHFRIFPVDIEGDIEITDFAGETTTMKDFAFRQFRVRATPVFAFFDSDGKYIQRARFTGATRDKQEFLLLGRYVVDGAYREQTFTRYKRASR